MGVQEIKTRVSDKISLHSFTEPHPQNLALLFLMDLNVIDNPCIYFIKDLTHDYLMFWHFRLGLSKLYFTLDCT